MNDDKQKVCEMAFKQVNKHIMFAESPEGEITYYGDRDDAEWEFLFNKSVYGIGKKFIHLFRLSEGNLIWVESYNFDTGESTIPVDLDDDTFLALAKIAHEKNITINQVMVDAVKEMCKIQKEIL
jgi:hypothetical protein